MSPTKASLARFNPKLLPRSNASESQRPRSQGSDSERLRERDGMNGHTRQDTSAGLAEPRNAVNGPGVASVWNANRQGLQATPRRRSRTPGKEYTPLKSTRPLVFPHPVASPPEEVREQANGVQTTYADGQAPIPRQPDTGGQFLGANGGPHASQSPDLPSTSTHRGLARATSGMGFSEDGEPSLPSTPVHLGLDAPPKSLKGLLFSSPSRRPKKGTAVARSSPLKPSDPATERPASSVNLPLSNLGPRVFIAKTPRPPPKLEEAEELRMQESLAGLEKQLQDIEDRLIRQTLVSKWQQEDSKEIKELSKLKRDVSTRSTKVMRSREKMLQYKAAKSTDQTQAGLDSMRQDTAEPRP